MRLTFPAVVIVPPALSRTFPVVTFRLPARFTGPLTLTVSLPVGPVVIVKLFRAPAAEALLTFTVSSGLEGRPSFALGVEHGRGVRPHGERREGQGVAGARELHRGTCPAEKSVPFCTLTASLPLGVVSVAVPKPVTSTPWAFLKLAMPMPPMLTDPMPVVAASGR